MIPLDNKSVFCPLKSFLISVMWSCDILGHITQLGYCAHFGITMNINILINISIYLDAE